MNLYSLFILMICMYYIHTQNINQEGMTVQLSDKGLNYAAKLGAEIIAGKVKNMKIPNYNGNSAVTVFNLLNISITKFEKPNVAISIQNDSLLKVTLKAEIEVNLNWEYQIGAKWLKFKDKGTAAFTTPSFSVILSVKFNKDKQGVPNAILTGCLADMNSLDIKFNGRLTTIYKLFTSLFDKKIKKKIEDVICEQATKVMNNETKNELASLNTKAKVDSQVYLDYTLLAPPTLTDSYMETIHAGEFFTDSLRYQAAVTAQSISLNLPNATNMVRIILTEKTLNSAAFVYYKLGRLSYSLNLSMAEAQNILNINASYPLMINLRAKYAPGVNIRPNSPFIVAVAEITVNGLIDENNVTNLLEASVDITMDADVTVEGDRIKCAVRGFSKLVTIVKNKISQVSDEDFIAIFGQFVDNSQGGLNEMGAAGFPLPALKNVNFKNVTLKKGDSFFVIDADLGSEDPPLANATLVGQSKYNTADISQAQNNTANAAQPINPPAQQNNQTQPENTTKQPINSNTPLG